MVEQQTQMTGWGRVIDYLFGRNALIGVASLMLLVISGYATWSGMSDFIVGVQTGASSQLREIGGLSVSSEMLVIAIVVALTFLMWLALREAFRIKQTFTARAITLPLYIFLALWSIGFGYGFWWSLIAGEEATRAGLGALQEDARETAAVVSARLDAVKVQLDSVVSWSDGQMRREETSGGSCGVASGAGRGRLYNARLSVRDSIASLRQGVVTNWLEPVQRDVTQLRETATRLSAGSTLERQREFERLATGIRSSANSIAARSNALGKSTAIEMNALASAVSVRPGEEGFSCYDPTLAQRLRQAADQAGQPVNIDLPPAQFNEGPAGVANAVKNLWTGLGGMLASGFAALTGEAGNAGQAGAALTGRDLIALLATLGIDLGLFALTALNPPRAAVQRDALEKTKSHLRIPEGRVIQLIAGAINTAMARAQLAHRRATFHRNAALDDRTGELLPDGAVKLSDGTILPEKHPPDFDWIRQHFVYHAGSSYFVIPNLYSCDTKDREEAQRALAMNQLAGVLDDLDLIRPLSKKELERAADDEKRESYSRVKEDEKIRNHGLFSKSRRALVIAGWSEKASMDMEVFRLTDTEGLTPLLIVLNEAEGQRLVRKQEADRQATEAEGSAQRRQEAPQVDADAPGLIAGQPDVQVLEDMTGKT